MKGVHVFLVVLAGCVVVGAVVTPYLVRRFGESSAERAAMAGAAFGEGRAQDECVGGALEYAKSCDSFLCRSDGVHFTTGCLVKSTPNREVCAGVPEDALSLVTWPDRRCAELGSPSRSCPSIHAALWGFCRATRETQPRAR